MAFIRKEKPDADESYESKTSAKDFPKRVALPGRSKSDKHAPIKRGEPITSPNLIGKWSAR